MEPYHRKNFRGSSDPPRGRYWGSKFHLPPPPSNSPCQKNWPLRRRVGLGPCYNPCKFDEILTKGTRDIFTFTCWANGKVLPCQKPINGFRPIDVSPHGRFAPKTLRPTDDVNINKNLCGRDGRTICGPQCLPKSTSVTLAGPKRRHPCQR